MPDFPQWMNAKQLTTWPGELTPTYRRKRAAFSASLSSTRQVLATELKALRCTTMVTEVALETEGMWRLDGRPRTTARLEHPGVVMSLPSTKVGPLRYATDAFTTWDANLRAIALGLEALRKVERYGITRRGEQYMGFQALPPGRPMPGGSMDVNTAYTVVAEAAGVGTQTVRHANPDALRDLYRRASRRVHPDSGGSTEDFQRLQEAMRLLRGDTGGAR